MQGHEGGGQKRFSPICSHFAPSPYLDFCTTPSEMGAQWHMLQSVLPLLLVIWSVVVPQSQSNIRGVNLSRWHPPVHSNDILDSGISLQRKTATNMHINILVCASVLDVAAHHCTTTGCAPGHLLLGDWYTALVHWCNGTVYWCSAVMAQPLVGDKPSGTYFSPHFRWQAHGVKLRKIYIQQGN